MNAICLNCTLKRSPEPSSTASLSDVVMSALRDEGVETDTIRLVDHQIEPGVVSEAVVEGDEWPAIRERILAAEILVVATPTWLAQPSSVSKRALERMDAFLSKTHRPDGRSVRSRHHHRAETEEGRSSPVRMRAAGHYVFVGTTVRELARVPAL